MNSTFLDFLMLQKTAVELIKEKKYEEVIVKLESAKIIFPKKIDRIGHWLSSIYCILNNKEQALLELKEVLNKGLYWNPTILINDPDLALIQETKEFSEIIQHSEEMYNFHNLNSSSKLYTQGNKHAQTSITALHWKNSNAQDFLEQIGTDELNKKYLFSYVQSSQLFSNGCYHWDNYDVAKNDIEDKITEFENISGTTIKNRIIFGASQGADTAIKMYFEPESNFKKVIALVPTLTDFHTIEEKLQNHRKTNIELIIITGDEDIFYNNVLDAMPIFEEYNIPCKLLVIEGMRHTIPNDFEELLEDLVEENIQ